MNEPLPHPAPAADPATPTQTPTLALTDRLAQMSDDIRVQMESCGRGPAGQLERAWLGLMLLLFRLLCDLAGKAMPAWMDEAWADYSREQRRRVPKTVSSPAPCAGAGSGGFMADRETVTHSPYCFPEEDHRQGFSWPEPVCEPSGFALADCHAAPDEARPSSRSAPAHRGRTATIQPEDAARTRGMRRAPRPRWYDLNGRRLRGLGQQPRLARTWTATVLSLRHR